MDTKLLMLIIDEDRKEQLEVFLAHSGVSGYTELPRALGVGTTGPRLGSGAYPKTSAVIFTIVDANSLEKLVADLRTYCQECGERLRMMVWGVEEVVV